MGDDAEESEAMGRMKGYAEAEETQGSFLAMGSLPQGEGEGEGPSGAPALASPATTTTRLCGREGVERDVEGSVSV